MIFEYWMDPTDVEVGEDYAKTSSELRELLSEIDGFLGVERFESCSESGKFAAIGFFDSEDAVASWRNQPAHRRAQQLGRSSYFSDYRLRMAEVTRDYGPKDWAEAPADSNDHHGRK